MSVTLIYCMYYDFLHHRMCWSSLIQRPFLEVTFSSQESERSCICVGRIHFFCFYDFSIAFENCSKMWYYFVLILSLKHCWEWRSIITLILQYRSTLLFWWCFCSIIWNEIYILLIVVLNPNNFNPARYGDVQCYQLVRWS